MNILDTIIKLIGIIIMAAGVVFVYDARKITNKFFSASDANTATRSFKIIGLIIFLIGGATLVAVCI